MPPSSDQPRAPHPRRASAWLIPAGAVGGLAAIVAGVLIALAVSAPDEVAGVSPSPRLSQSASATETQPNPGASVTPVTSSPTPAALAALPNRAIAVITEAGNALHLRRAADTSSSSMAMLSTGARVFIIGAPEVADGYNWYRVSIVDGPIESSCVDACPAIGWVATPPSGEPWLVDANVACGTPTTIQDLDALLPLERLSCFGREDLTLTGPVEEWGVTGCQPPFPVYSPAWLVGGGCDGGVKFAGVSSFFEFITSPESGVSEPPTPAGLRVIAHFEDPAAPSCRLIDDAGGLQISAADLVLRCRTKLVVTDYEVIALP
jgi:hypothetical protein